MTLPTGEPGYPTVAADELRPHQAALRMPPPTDEEFAALVADIAEHGVVVPVLVDETGAILDGIHRWKACKRLNLPVPYRVLSGLTEVEKLNRALGMNLRRRHLSKDQKVVIAKGLHAEGHTYARIEEITGWPHSTVHDWLNPKKLEPTPPKPAPPTPSPETFIDRAIFAIRDSVETAAWDEEPITDDAARRFRQCQIDFLRGWTERLQAFTDGGKEGYFAYCEAHPFPKDIYEPEFGPAIPATEKWKDLDWYDRHGDRHPGRRPGM